MADENTAPETPTQSPEVRAAIINRSTAGGDTAIGNERRELNKNDEADQKSSTDDLPGGSTIPIVGGEPKPDYPQHDAPPAVGAQTQPANLSTNGTLPVGHVASPSGLVPVSAVTSDPHQGAKLVQENLNATQNEVLKSGNTKLSRAKIESMSAGELRAVASDRGYDIGDYAGARQTRSRFIKAQNDDEGLTDNAEATNTPAATE